MAELRHIPVMPREVRTLASVPPGGRIVDGTLGYGGHAEMLLDAFPEACLLGIDRDAEALSAARQRLERFGDRVVLRRGSYADMTAFVDDLEWDGVDAVLLDLGISSPQIDDASRGFSHRADGPLDMRMDMQSPVTAATVLNTRAEEELADIFFYFGEEPKARRVARAVVERRAQRPWERTAEFAKLVENVVSMRGQRGLPAATRCFQALRIAVNGELDQLQDGLDAALHLLRPGGRLVVIAFHSLEDRIVKNFMRHEAAPCVCPPKCPICICGKHATLRVLTRKAQRPGAEEVAANRRAASAKLRAAEKLAPAPDTSASPTHHGE